MSNGKISDDIEATDLASAYFAIIQSGLNKKAAAALLGQVGAAWTPVLTFATPGDLAVTYSTQSGVVFKVGKLRIAFFNLVTSAFTHSTASGNLRVTGLPEASGAAQARFGGVSLAGWTKANYTAINSRITVANPTIIDFVAMGSGQATSTLAVADVPTGASVIINGFIVYEVA